MALDREAFVTRRILDMELAVNTGKGRPRKYPTAYDLAVAVDSYVEHCEKTDTPLTVTGLTLWLGFRNRSELYDQGTYDEDYRAVLDTARLLVEHSYELRLHKMNVTGAIFALKNMGWTDKQELDVNDKTVQEMAPEVRAAKLKALIETARARLPSGEEVYEPIEGEPDWY